MIAWEKQKLLFAEVAPYLIIIAFLINFGPIFNDHNKSTAKKQHLGHYANSLHEHQVAKQGGIPNHENESMNMSKI